MFRNDGSPRIKPLKDDGMEYVIVEKLVLKAIGSSRRLALIESMIKGILRANLVSQNFFLLKPSKPSEKSKYLEVRETFVNFLSNVLWLFSDGKIDQIDRDEIAIDFARYLIAKCNHFKDYANKVPYCSIFETHFEKRGKKNLLIDIINGKSITTEIKDEIDRFWKESNLQLEYFLNLHTIMYIDMCSAWGKEHIIDFLLFTVEFIESTPAYSQIFFDGYKNKEGLAHGEAIVYFVNSNIKLCKTEKDTKTKEFEEIASLLKQVI